MCSSVNIAVNIWYQQSLCRFMKLSALKTCPRCSRLLPQLYSKFGRILACFRPFVEGDEMFADTFSGPSKQCCFLRFRILDSITRPFRTWCKCWFVVFQEMTGATRQKVQLDLLGSQLRLQCDCCHSDGSLSNSMHDTSLA